MTAELFRGCIGAFGGTVGFAYMLGAPGKTVFPASLTALLGYLLYELLYGVGGCSLIFSYFCATFVISVICEVAARRMRMPSTIFLLSAMVPLVPSYNFYRAMLALVEDNGAQAASAGLMALQGMAAIAVGAAVSSVLFRTLALWKLGKR